MSRSLGCWFPFLPRRGKGSRAAGWGSEGVGSRVPAPLMIHPSGFASGKPLDCSPRGGDLGSLFPYQEKGAGAFTGLCGSIVPSQGAVGAHFALD